jgi:hypothetical protein
MCKPQALRASGSQAATSRRDSTRLRQARQPPKRSGRPDLRGARSNSAVRMIFVSRGAALGPCGWPNAGGRRGERPVPRLYSLLAGDRQGSSGSMIRSAQTAPFFPAVRGAERWRTPLKGRCGVCTPPWEKRRRSDPTSIVPASGSSSYDPRRSSASRTGSGEKTTLARNGH